MVNFYKLASGIDVSKINAQLAANPQLWDEHTARKDSTASPHKQMQDIWLRYNNPDTIGTTAFNEEHDSVWYPAAERLSAAVMQAFNIMAAYRGERLGGVLITRIPPGGRIEPHIDMGWHVDYYDKFYLHLESPKGAKFCYDNATIEPKVGDLYWLDNSIRHWVENDGDTYRTTLIVCIKPFIRMQKFLSYKEAA